MIRMYTRPSPIADILIEHMEEAAFLYNCHRRALADAERSLEDLQAYENRMIPHLDGLAAAGFDSARLLQEKLTLPEDGDPGESFVAAAVYPMLGAVEPMQWLMEALGGVTPHHRALVDGLKFTRGQGIEVWLEHFLDHDNPAVRSAGAEAAGYRGLRHLQAKIRSMQKDADVAMAALCSLASMGVMPDSSMVAPFLDSEDPYSVVRAFELLLKLGDRGAVDAVREKTRTAEPLINEILSFFLAVSGTLSDERIIRDIIQTQPATEAPCLLALALCGNIDSIPFFIDRLGELHDPGGFMNACQGLRLMTGMDYLPQFDLEGAPAEKILEYQRAWKKWWEQNRGAFSPEAKWRRGQRLSPAVLAQDLAWPGNPCRYFAHLEAVLRYGCPVHYQYDQLYSVQSRQVQEVKHWADGEDRKFVPGLHYYHGRR